MSEIFYPTINPRITELAGTRGGTHMGIDLAATRGQAVYAPFDGVVIFSGDDGASGYLPGTNIVANGPALVVRIQRADGFIAHVAHMDFRSVVVGQRVIGGQTIIGGAGDTGWSTGVHVHLEFRWDLSWNGGNWVDPMTLNLQTINPNGGGPASPASEGDNEMKMIYRMVNGRPVYALFGPGFWFVFEGEAAATQFLAQGGGGAAWLATDGFWKAAKEAATKGSYDKSGL